MLTMVGTDCFAYEVETTVGCWAGQGTVETGELTGSEFAIGTR